MYFRLVSYPWRLSCPESLPQPGIGSGSVSATLVGTRYLTRSAGRLSTFTRAASAMKNGLGLSQYRVTWPILSWLRGGAHRAPAQGPRIVAEKRFASFLQCPCASGLVHWFKADIGCDRLRWRRLPPRVLS